MAMLLEEENGRGLIVLGESECRSLLAKKALGRVAVSVGALPAVFPVNYAVHYGDIYFLTEDGTKFAAALRGATVAFEIDDFDTRRHQGWSVLAVGHAHQVDPQEAEDVLAELPLNAWAPGPHEHLVRIHPAYVSGRRIGFTRDVR